MSEEKILIPLEQTDADIKIETISALGGKIETPNINFTITAGKLALLDLLDSPIIHGGKLEQRDLWIAAYVLTKGADAVQPINKALREIQALSTAKDLASTSTEFYEVYLASIRSSSSNFQEFDNEVMKFIEDSGFMSGDMQEVLSNAIETAMAGFTLIHPEKKKMS